MLKVVSVSLGHWWLHVSAARLLEGRVPRVLLEYRSESLCEGFSVW